MGSLSIWHWLVVLAVVVLIFGTKKLKNVGTDLGQAIRGFKSAMNEGEQQANDAAAQSQAKPKLSEQAAAPEAKQPAQNERQS